VLNRVDRIWIAAGIVLTVLAVLAIWGVLLLFD